MTHPITEDKGDLLRGVPVAILIALVLQIGGTIWWAASMTTRLDQNDRVITALLARIERLETSNQKLLVDVVQSQAEIRHVLRHKLFEPPT